MEFLKGSLKINVSYKNHRRMIGPKGSQIKTIMGETSTFIHFPDRNLTHPEKNNHVSIDGYLKDIGRARYLIRSVTPFTIAIPTNKSYATDELLSATVNYTEILFNVKINIYLTKIVVRGITGSPQNVETAVQMIYNHIYKSYVEQSKILVQATIEISSSYDSLVRGENDQNILKVERTTKTKITLRNDAINVPDSTQILIRGPLDNMREALYQLIDLLPVFLQYNQKIVSSSFDTKFLTEIGRRHGLCIAAVPKKRHNEFIVRIFGVEKYLNTIFYVINNIQNLVRSHQHGIPSIQIDSFQQSSSCRNNLHDDIFEDSPLNAADRVIKPPRTSKYYNKRTNDINSYETSSTDRDNINKDDNRINRNSEWYTLFGSCSLNLELNAEDSVISPSCIYTYYNVTKYLKNTGETPETQEDQFNNFSEESHESVDNRFRNPSSTSTNKFDERMINNIYSYESSRKLPIADCTVKEFNSYSEDLNDAEALLNEIACYVNPEDNTVKESKLFYSYSEDLNDAEALLNEIERIVNLDETSELSE